MAERPSHAPNGSAARLRDSLSRDERAWREAKRAGAKSAQVPSLTGTCVGHGESLGSDLSDEAWSIRLITVSASGTASRSLAHERVSSSSGRNSSNFSTVLGVTFSPNATVDGGLANTRLQRARNSDSFGNDSQREIRSVSQATPLSSARIDSVRRQRVPTQGNHLKPPGVARIS